MIFLLKRLFVAPPPEPPTPFSVRVVPYTRDASYYAIEYRLPDEWRWHTYRYAWMVSSDYLMWNDDQPYLYLNHSAAVEAAKALTPEGIIAHNAAQAELYATKVAEAKAAIKARSITTYVQ